jgi:hypothetical protein
VKGTTVDKLYKNRKLAQGYPDLERLAFEKYIAILDELEKERSDERLLIEKLLAWLDRLVDLGEHKNVLVLGCGPRPLPIKILIQKNYNAVGVEPIPSFISSAKKYLGSPDRI